MYYCFNKLILTSVLLLCGATLQNMIRGTRASLATLTARRAAWPKGDGPGQRSACAMALPTMSAKLKSRKHNTGTKYFGGSPLQEGK